MKLQLINNKMFSDFPLPLHGWCDFKRNGVVSTSRRAYDCVSFRDPVEFHFKIPHARSTTAIEHRRLIKTNKRTNKQTKQNKTNKQGHKSTQLVI